MSPRTSIAANDEPVVFKPAIRIDDVVVGEQRAPDAAWYYPEPKDAAKEITGRVAFWRGVIVTSD